MLTFNDFYEQVSLWRKDGKYQLIGLSAQKRLEASNLLCLGHGSYWYWMDKDWFAKAKILNVLKQNRNGQWVPVADYRSEDVAVGQKGRETIYEKQSKLSLRRFDEFAASYEDWLTKQQRTNLYMNSLLSQEPLLPPELFTA